MNHSATKPAPTKPSSRPKDAIALLRADHKFVGELFDAFENARTGAQKRELVSRICTELTVHTQAEEEIFYPLVKKALQDTALVPEATVEHATLKDLIAQLQDHQPDGEMYDAKVKVLSEYVRHHVKEEQTEMFPKAKETSLDMVAIGALIADRKQEILADLQG